MNCCAIFNYHESVPQRDGQLFPQAIHDLIDLLLNQILYHINYQDINKNELAHGTKSVVTYGKTFL
jgi:hypothetical protein